MRDVIRTRGGNKKPTLFLRTKWKGVRQPLKKQTNKIPGIRDLLKCLMFQVHILQFLYIQIKEIFHLIGFIFLINNL